MPVRRRAALVVALLTAAAALLPVSASAEQPEGQLRGGLRAIARGEAPVGTIETRSIAGRDDVAVSIELIEPPAEHTRALLREAGLSIRGAWETTIEGFVAPSRLRELARVAGVESIMPIRRPLAAGFVGPAPALHGAASWGEAGYLGTRVKVGILDDGFDGFSGLMGTELPATVQARCYAQLGIASAVLADCVTPGEKHGTAVAESIVDMAPGVSLYISNARTPADLAATVSWMTSSGVKIINYSQASPILLEGMGDGTSRYTFLTYSLVERAVLGGALFVTAAGNSGETSWMGVPADTDADRWVDFAPGEEANYLDLQADQEIAAAIRWPSAATDYDVSIWQGDTLLVQSADDQSATGDPFEIVDFTAPSAGRYEIGIWHDDGPAATNLRLMVWSGGATQLAYRTTAGSLPAPADSRNPGLITVGAVDYLSPTIVEPYSSRGPTLDGRTKPDLVAVDCAPTISYTVFCGTSEATPYVSGAAALVVESNPALTPAQLAAYLRARATPIGSPVPNNDTGYGRLALGAPPNQPATLAFLAPAASGAAGAPFIGQPMVGIVDAEGQLVTRGPGAGLPVTLSIASNAGSGTLTCPAGLTGNGVAGIVRFTGCAIDTAGSGYVLRADAPGLVGAVGAPFAVAAAGTPPALTLSGSAATLTYGTAITLRARATLPGGASVPIDAVRVVGGMDVEPRATMTDGAGLAAWTFKPIVTSEYRLRFVAPGTGLMEVSAPLRVRVNATASLGSSVPNGRTISRKTSIVLTTTIRPIGALVTRGRARIDLFQRTSSGWTRRRTVYANADATGRAKATIRLPSAGSWWIRSRAEPTATNGPSAWTAGVKYTVR